MPERDYTIQSVAKALRVLEALEGTNFEPISLKEVARRAGQNTNYTFRTLETCEQMGWARRKNDRWQIGSRLSAIAGRFSESFTS
jgi:DNA-binding IclR family transcriptional regulator